MTLDAVDASGILVETSEAGGSAAQLVVIGGGAPADMVGRRLALTRGPGRSPELVHGGLGDARTDRAGADVLRAALDDPRAPDGVRVLQADPAGASIEVYLELRRPVRELVVVGAGHIAQPLARVGTALGFRVTILDDRPAFATRERFPEAHRIIQADFDAPFRDVPIHERSHVLLVTRGHKYDYACLVRALRLDPLPAYIGMIGSRRRVRATYVQLLEDGIDRRLLERIHAPVGLDIGAETPEEIAVAVAAELVLHHRGGTGAPLKDVERITERYFTNGSTEGEA